MLKNLRKKMNSVLPDMDNLYISNNVATTPSPSRDSKLASPQNGNKTISARLVTSNVVNLSAGCDILEYNEGIWEEIHSVNEQNASKAQCIDLVIESLTDCVNKKLIDLSDINVSLEAIPNIVKTVQNCSNIMYDVNKKCTDVEKSLVELENLIEALQLQERQLDSKLEMAMYKERKLANLEKMRKELATKHAINVKETENQLSVIQKERQAVFQDAFQNDLNCYKELGTIPKIESKPSAKPSLKLEEIVLDNVGETNELNEFLNST